MDNNAKLAIYGLCILWCGALIGVSFIATPAKFLVVELDIVTAIKVGRATFGIYHYFEAVMICITVLSLFYYRVEKAVWAYFALLGLVLVLQYFLVQPLVERSSDNLFAGVQSSAKSNAHFYYILCDCLKVSLLAGFLPAINFVKK